MDTKYSLNFIDLFAGAGGLSCGLEMAGHHCLLGLDFNADAMETFKKNHPKAKTYCGDISQLSNDKVQELLGKNKHNIGLVVGGPPCQGFSTVGRGDPCDKRNQLFLEFVRIVSLTKPSFFIMENVTGLLAKKNEETLKSILNCFYEIGYEVLVQVVSAEEYGVPERRRRTIFLGSRLHSKEELYFPFPLTKEKPITVGEAFSKLKAKDGHYYNHDLTHTEIKNPLDKKRLEAIPEGHGIRYEKDEKKFLPKSLRLSVDWTKLKENRFRQTKYLRLNRKKPSPTILTHRSMYYHPTEPRYLTVREAAKLQSFPNDFIFCGTLTSMWRQIGNAVPPELGKVFGEHLKLLLKKIKGHHKKSKKESKVPSLDKIRGSAFIYKAPKLKKNERNNSL